MKDEDKKKRLGQQGIFEQQEWGNAGQEEQQRQIPKVRTSRALDNNLMTMGKQLSLFDELEDADNPRNIVVNQEQLQCGLRLDGGGWELILALQELLFLHSINTTDQSREDYYRGELTDKGKLAVTTWGGKKAPGAFIKTTLAELTKIRIGEDRKLSQKDLDRTKELLGTYADVFTLRYIEYYTDPNKKGANKTNKRYIETKDNLYSYTIIADEGTRSDIVRIGLKQIFFSQITTNYNYHPLDLKKRLKKAYIEAAGKKIAKVPDNLYDFIFRLIDAQNYKDCIYHSKLMGEDGLYMMISPAAVKARQWKKVDLLLNQYADVAKKIGLLISWDKKPSKNSGEMIATFKVVEQTMWS